MAIGDVCIYTGNGVNQECEIMSDLIYDQYLMGGEGYRIKVAGDKFNTIVSRHRLKKLPHQNIVSCWTDCVFFPEILRNQIWHG